MADTDNRTQYSDLAIGANDPSARTDNQNKLMLAYHDNNGRSKLIGGSSVASASSISVPDNENYFVVTGTTTITAIASTTSGASAIDTGVIVWLKFSAALTLTHNGTSLILPNAADITTVAEDVFSFRHEGSGNWRMIGRSPGGATVFGFQNVQVITANGTYTKTAGITHIRVRLVGGGGGGAGGVSTAAGGGGGAGGYAEEFIDATGITSETATIGAGGGGGTGAAGGSAGGTTSLGSLISATGGSGGVHAGFGGTPGLGAGGDINLYGGYGDGRSNSSTSATVGGGAGGASYFGGGGCGGVLTSSSNGVTGVAPGSGGGGAASGAAGLVGGNGAAGIIIVEEYINA